ncbi:hypothetical protein HDU87_000242 [Geranomyces variabilis]|uniref:Uncharacterized protein n=1 Tax=Geranomyces variabilis TaxID=109894 RepID=A0AAD5TUF4_9FUNG|nr:hypothetical protein HDU87_000242 [Geranomyces variabilis]
MSDEQPETPAPADEAQQSEAPTNDNAVPEQPKPQPSDVDLAIIVTPAQAVELNRRAEEIKNGYALLAMKRLENVFDGLDDENAGGEDGAEGQKPGGIDLQAEEDKLHAAMASYAQQMEECGIPNGSPEYLAALEALAAGANATAEEPEQPPASVVPPVEKVVKPVEPLPYHDVWKHGDQPTTDTVVPVVVAEVPEAAEEVVQAAAVPDAAVVEPSAPPVEEAPVAASIPAAAPAKVPKKALPPVVVRPTRGRGRGIPLTKQSIPARTLALSFSTFPTSFPGEASAPLPAQNNGPQFPSPVVMSSLTFNGPNAYQQGGYHQQHHAPAAASNRTATATSVSQLPLDANALRAVHPVASSTSSKTGITPLGGAGFGQRTTTAGGSSRPAVGGGGAGAIGGMTVMNTGSPSTGRYGWSVSAQNNQQQQQSQSSSPKRVAGSQLVGGVSQAIVGGTGLPSSKIIASAAAAGTEAAAAQNAIASPAVTMSLTPRTATTSMPGLIGGGVGGPAVGAGLPPIRNSPTSAAQKLALHAGAGAARRAGGAPH